MAPSPLLAVEDKGGNNICSYTVTIQEPEARIKRKPVLVMVILCQCSA